MENVNEKLDYEVESIESVQTEESANSRAVLVMHDFEAKVSQLQSRVDLVKGLVDRDEFRLLSKTSRNALIYDLIYESRDAEELAKVAFRTLKKIKRERISEDRVDELLGVPESVRNAVTDEDDE